MKTSIVIQFVLFSLASFRFILLSLMLLQLHPSKRTSTHLLRLDHPSPLPLTRLTSCRPYNSYLSLLSPGSGRNPVPRVGSDYLLITIEFWGWLPDPPKIRAALIKTSAGLDGLISRQRRSWYLQENLLLPLAPPGKKRLCTILYTEAKHHILAGYVGDRLETLPDEAKPRIMKRNRLRTIVFSIDPIKAQQTSNRRCCRECRFLREKW